MKKTSRSKLVRIARKRERKRALRLSRVRYKSRKLSKSWISEPFELIKAPRKVTISDLDWRDQTVEFLASIRCCRRNLLIDFSPTTLFEVGATLLLHAIVDGMKSRFSNVKIRCVLPKQRREIEVLSHTGLLQDFGRSAVTVRKADVAPWRVASGTDADLAYVGGLIEEVLPEVHRSRVYSSLSEGICNAVEHSQGSEFFDSSRWWAFLRQNGSRFIIALCDLGVGIPKTLRDKGLTEKVLSLYAAAANEGRRDAVLVKAATELGRTRTEQSNRGWGLFRMVELVKKLRGSQILICSNRGSLFVNHMRGALNEFKGVLPKSIGGTLIIWAIDCGATDSGGDFSDEEGV